MASMACTRALPSRGDRFGWPWKWERLLLGVAMSAAIWGLRADRYVSDPIVAGADRAEHRGGVSYAARAWRLAALA